MVVAIGTMAASILIASTTMVYHIQKAYMTTLIEVQEQQMPVMAH